MDAYSKFSKAQLIEQIHLLTTELNEIKSSNEYCMMAHELRVHQTELEAQNQELREMQNVLELARDRYADLYDFAPVGYVTLDQHGIIKDINLTGATLLGRERALLLGESFHHWLDTESVPVFARHLKNVHSLPVEVTDEIKVKSRQGQIRTVNITSLANTSVKNGEVCRSILVDLTERMLIEERLRLSKEVLRDLCTHHETVREEERRKVAREIHDELGQALLALKMDVAMLSESLNDVSPLLLRKTSSMMNLINRTVESVRNIATNLRPAVLDLGVVPALEWLIDEYIKHVGLNCIFETNEEDLELPDEVSTGIFRIVQESLTNVARHARASRVEISLIHENNELCLIVKDDGIGVDEGKRMANRKSFGLTGIRERAIMMGGELSLDSSPGKGATLTVVVPMGKKEKKAS
ncbi:PAS domain-containing sensor histidine kinase [Sulfurirhabdus autotrophica]|uniref:Oxygen sensor histidine kinase NreB n=1 Tax=Sulfurirhabdus autotrophica TaxID=1706046 RepID=A0A4R3Y1T0_9PROT|nr:ATP-binding protein [Sulfurirhabdus autotrophica]TCV85402.1 PAS domain S-box-containing protein [Sulfurirhabdus autotrophica]